MADSYQLGHRFGSMLKQAYQYSSTEFRMPPDLADEVRALGREIPREDLRDKGREQLPHVTARYGLETQDHREVAKALLGTGPLKARLGKVSIFPDSKNRGFDVVKIDVDSPGLVALNKQLASLKHTDTHPRYRPHVTIGYVRPGVGKRYAGDSRFEGREIDLKDLVFSTRHGSRWIIPLV